MNETHKNLKRILEIGTETNLMSDAINNWIDVQKETSLLPVESEAYKNIFSTINLAAHVFDPKYKDHRLSPSQRQLVHFFVSRQLNDSDEYEKFDEYLEETGFFNEN